MLFVLVLSLLLESIMLDAQLFLQPKLVPTWKHLLNCAETYGEMLQMYIGIRVSMAIQTLYGSKPHPFWSVK